MFVFDVFLIIFVVLVLLGVMFEEVIYINKVKVMLFFGIMSWMLFFLFSDNVDEMFVIFVGLFESIVEIVGLWLFFVVVMMFVVYLNKKGMIENVIYLIMLK